MKRGDFTFLKSHGSEQLIIGFGEKVTSYNFCY